MLLKNGVPERTRGTRITAYPFFLLAALLCLPTFVPGTAAGADPTLLTLQRKAEQLRLHEAPEWRALLHWRSYWWGERSVIDDPRFFLSPQGRKDPEAELQATLAALFGDWEPSDRSVDTDDPRGPHPRCRFPARLEWLSRALDVPPPPLPPGTCWELERAMERIAPQSATLVFPAAHINNPGSMFGHTLLRVEAEHESALLAHALNYAAQIGEDENGIAYAFKGLFGFYPGYFSVLPYYEKVKQYGSIEQRDIWEYRLSLKQEEVRRMTLHAWELRGMFSDYFFFDENCSFNLLYFLEVARPDVSLTADYGGWVTPLATVEDVLASGLVESTDYRPSLATTLHYTAKDLDHRGVEWAQRLVHGNEDPVHVLQSDLKREDQARVLDIAALFEQMRLTQGDTDKAAYQKRYLEILRPRSRLPGVDQVAPTIPEPPRPERGHSSSRLYAAAGWRTHESMIEGGFRPAYHEIMDPDVGFNPGAQINFFDTAVRFYPSKGRLSLQRLDLVNILSLSPRDEFFSPISFHVRGGARSKPFARDADGVVGAVAGGGGFCWGNEGMFLYLMGETEADASSRYPSAFAIGAGGSAGLVADLHDGWKTWFFARAVPYLYGEEQPDLSFGVRQSLRVARNHAAAFDVERLASSGIYHTLLCLRWNLYF